MLIKNTLTFVFAWAGICFSQTLVAGDHYYNGYSKSGKYHEAEILLDVPYADLSSSQLMDIYIPEGYGNAPVIVLIHGGGFFRGSKSSRNLVAKAEYLQNAGYVVASIDYRLSGEANFPAPVHDCKAAVRFLRANARAYYIDKRRIGAWGESAGANLAAMLGTSAGIDALEGEELGNSRQSSKIQAAVLWFPPVNFLTQEQEALDLGFVIDVNGPDSPESLYMGFPVQTDPKTVYQANPTTYIDKTDPSFYIQAGDADILVPYTQSQNFFFALCPIYQETKNKVAIFELLPGVGHGDGRNNPNPFWETEATYQKQVDFFDEYLRDAHHFDPHYLHKYKDYFWQRWKK